MCNFKAQSLLVQKLWPRLNLPITITAPDKKKIIIKNMLFPKILQTGFIDNGVQNVMMWFFIQNANQYHIDE